MFGSGQRSGAVVSAVAVGASMNSSFSVWLLVQPGPVLLVQAGPVLLVQPGPVLHYRNLVTLNA